jgi:antirestriction protein ArdC
MASRQLNSKALEKFAGLMIEKIREVSNDWNKPWISAPAGAPQNAITGRSYSGMNNLMLFFSTEKNNFKLPAFLTYDQAAKAGTFVKKGEKAFPVVYWQRSWQDKENPKKFIKSDEYKSLTKEEQEKYREKLMLKEYSVFNVAQTNIREDKPELYKKIEDSFNFPKLKDENGMYKHAGMDNMLENQSWVCKINVQDSNSAFYRPKSDEITVPLKAQFSTGENFYSVLLHEMAHSTGAESRLNRELSTIFGNEKYAKEELVAEMTAALTSGELGISTTIREENAKYLKNWLEGLTARPEYILTILSDVQKASNMIHNAIPLAEEKADKKESAGIAMGDKPVQTPEANLFELFDKEQRYLYQNREVKFTGYSAGGVYGFQYVDSGKPFQLMAGKGNTIKSIKPVNMEKFTENEIPKNLLKEAGLKYSELSAVDRKSLLAGKETKAMTVKNAKGEKTEGTLSLKRNRDKSVSLVIKPVQSSQKASRRLQAG